MGKQLRKGDGYFMDDSTPTEEIREFLRYLLIECKCICEWRLAKLLLQKEDFEISDFFLIFSHFDGKNLDTKTNNDIQAWASMMWKNLKMKGLNNQDLVMFSQFPFHGISSDAWNLLTKRELDQKNLISIVTYGKHSEATYAFQKLNHLPIVTDLGNEDICRIFHRIISDGISEDLRVLYFNLFKKQEKVIKQLGQVTLRHVHSGSIENPQNMLYVVYNEPKGSVITLAGRPYQMRNDGKGGLSTSNIQRSRIVA